MNFDILRQKILEKAIRGELVPQLESEPEVKQIGEAPEDVPFAIPEKWKWLPLNKFSEKRRTVSPNTITGEVELWSIPAYDAGSPEKVNSKHIGSSKKEVVNGDVLLSKIVPNIKRAWIVKSDHPHKLASTEWLTFSGKNILDPEFMRQVFLSPYFRGKMMDTISGMGSLKRANPGILQQTLIPVPHLQEQRRIVTKINQLFEQIDFAEKAYDELSGPLAERFRQLCLEKAIQGKLVLQLESEPEVEQIGEAPAEILFEIPKKWKWCRLKELTFPAKQKIPDKEFLYLDVSSIDQTTKSIKGFKKLNSSTAPSRARKSLKEGMVLFATVRPYLLNTVIFEGNKNNIEAIASTAFATFTCNESLLNIYIWLVLQSPYFFDYVCRSQRGVSYPAITDKQFFDAYIPLPSLKEQCRIVAKLNKLLSDVTKIESPVSTP